VLDDAVDQQIVACGETTSTYGARSASREAGGGRESPVAASSWHSS